MRNPALLLLLILMPCAAIAAGSRVNLTLDSSEADQVLAILALRAAGQPIDDAQWQKLFATEPYQRLKVREAAIAKRFNAPENELKDENFKKFVTSDDLLKRAPELRATLARWKQADLQETGRRVLQYLPASAIIRAKVYPTIKPNNNSFVWDAATNPAIFLYLDPQVSEPKFENTVAHELHHIGLASSQADYEERIKVLPERPRAVADAMAAFGEGLAMLAAAGSVEVDPHAASSPRERARWEHDMANFDHDLQEVNAFFLDVLNGKFANQDAIEEKASSFYGAQGPWYTVGYKMAVMVEKRFGRDALIQTMLDPRRLLVLYNQAAAEQNPTGKGQLPRWSDEVLKRVQAPLT
jgi:Putative zinc dependent peptidase (DUF5700)